MRIRHILGESIKTDFFDMYLLSSLPHQNHPEVSSLLTDRLDRLIAFYRRKLFIAYAIRIDAVTPAQSNGDFHNPQRHMGGVEGVYEQLLKITDPLEMSSVIKNAIEHGLQLKDVRVDKRYIKYAIHHKWANTLPIFYKLCENIDKVDQKIMVLDRLFGLAHNSGPLTDYLEDNPRRPWLYDALFIRALAHPNELYKYASDEARIVAKSAYLGPDLGTSLSGYKEVTDKDKYDLLSAKERPQYPQYSRPPSWLRAR